MNSRLMTPQTPACSAPPGNPQASATTTTTAPVELLTQVQMAGRLGISRRTLHSWVREGLVPMIKVRGFCRFEYHKVLAALQQHEQTVETMRAQGIENPGRPYDGCSVYGALQSLQNNSPTTPIR